VLEVPEEVSRTQSVGTRRIILASLLWGSWCHNCLLRDIGVGLSGIGIGLPSIGVDLSGIDLSGVSRLKACT
jgi:hypothetical protein